MKKVLISTLVWGGLSFGVLAGSPSEVSHKNNVEAILAKDVKNWTIEDYENLSEELKALRKANWEGMTKEEKKALKKELRDVKREVKATKRIDGGIYLSASAVLIIILVLIILL